MRSDQWFHFLASGEPPAVTVARLPYDLARVIGANTDRVMLRHDYALKMAHKHKLGPGLMPMLPITIDCGRAIADRARNLVFFFPDPVIFGVWFHAVVKANAAGDELLVSTFHKQRPSEVRRLCKKGELIRAEKR